MALLVLTNSSNYTRDIDVNLIRTTGCGKVAILFVHSAKHGYGQKVATISLIIVNAVTAFIAVFGNALFLYTVKNSKVLRGPTYILTGTLSLLDFFVGIILQPLFILAIGWQFFRTENVCDYYWVFSILAPIFACGSMTILTLIGIDRFVAVVFNLSYRSVVTKNRAISGVVIATVINITCGILAYLDNKGPIYFTTVSAVTGVSYVLMILCYGTIGLVLKLRKSILIASATMEITKAIALASVVCGLCWLPFIIILPFVSNAINPKDAESLLTTMYVYQWLSSLLMVNSALNFGIYVWRSQIIRREILLQLKWIRRILPFCPMFSSVHPSNQEEESPSNDIFYT